MFVKEHKLIIEKDKEEEKENKNTDVSANTVETTTKTTGDKNIKEK